VGKTCLFIGRQGDPRQVAEDGFELSPRLHAMIAGSPHLKRDALAPGQLEAALATMTTLNADAASAMREAGAGAATDVTGFGLLGHLRKMLEASGAADTQTPVLIVKCPDSRLPP